MTKPAKTGQEPAVVNLPPPGSGNGRLKASGGSASDDFNNILANQAVSALWLAHSDSGGRDKQFQAALAAMVSVGPSDELEGMLAAKWSQRTARRWSVTGAP